MHKVTKRILISIALLSGYGGSSFAEAQETGDCELGDASVDLETAGVRATLYNTGGLFWRGGNAEYEVPQGSGLTSIFAAGIWMGGYVEGELRFAGADYSNWEFYPGPIPEDGSPPTAAYCAGHDRLYRVTIDDIAHFNATGETTPDLADWPFELGAPVVDNDGDPTNYNLEAGDRPAILGGETVWWVMNDRGAGHNWGFTEPLGVEVRVTTFAFPETYSIDRFGVASFASELSHVTLYRLAITYRGTAPLDSFVVALWMDADLGDPGDDFIGSSPLLALGYIYNADNDDELGRSGYGVSPPAFGATFLNAPTDSLLYSFITPVFEPCPVDCGIHDADDAYRLMNAHWHTGPPLTRGGNGRDPNNPVTRHMYDGLPGSFWSETCSQPGCPVDASNEPGDRRFLMSVGPMDIVPNETVEVDFGLVFGRSIDGHLASVDKLFANVSQLREVYAQTDLFRPDPRLTTILPRGEPPGESPTAPETYGLAVHAWPNPVTTEAVIRYDLPEASTVRLAVYDVQGREVAVLAEGAQEAGFQEAHIEASQWPNGVYLYRLDAGNRRKASGVFTVLRQ